MFLCDSYVSVFLCDSYDSFSLRPNDTDWDTMIYTHHSDDDDDDFFMQRPRGACLIDL